LYLMVIITKEEEKTLEFLRLLVTIGVKGATVVDGRGMGRILQEQETYFTSIEQVLTAQIDLTENTLILSVIHSGEILAEARKLARKVFGDFSKANTGVLFVLPVMDAEGVGGAKAPSA
jgi:DUF917 family protein